MTRSIAILLIGLMLASVSGATDDAFQLNPESPRASIVTLDSPTPSTPFLQSFGIEGPAALVAQQGCCKICRAGKACGDTCISRDKICHVGPGCACDG